MSKELFSQLSTAYNLIPSYEPGGIIRRINAELKPVLSKKIQDAIAQSPTTDFYKIVVPKLVEKVYNKGKRMPGSEEEIALIEALQLSDPDNLGIFNKDRAAKGESNLFLFVLRDFVTNFMHDIANGKDPDGSIGVNPDDALNSSFFPDKSMTEMKDFLLKWEGQYRKTHGKPILAAPNIKSS